MGESSNHGARYIDRVLRNTAYVQWFVYGTILFLVGMDWYWYGASEAFVSTAEGVMIVEGGARNGIFKAPVVSAVGLTMAFVAATAWKARRGGSRR